MRDTWGPPDTGWPSFDENGRRVVEEANEQCPDDDPCGWCIDCND